MAGLKKTTLTCDLENNKYKYHTVGPVITLQSQHRRTRQKWLDVHPNAHIRDRSLYCT